MVQVARNTQKVTRTKKTVHSKKTEQLSKNEKTKRDGKKRMAKKARKSRRALRKACSTKPKTLKPATKKNGTNSGTISTSSTPNKTLPGMPNSTNWSRLSECKVMSTPETEKRTTRKRKLKDVSPIRTYASPIAIYKRACQQSPSPSPGTPPRCGDGEYTFIYDPTSPGDDLSPMIPKAARMQGFRRAKSGIMEASAVLDVKSFLDMSGIPDKMSLQDDFQEGDQMSLEGNFQEEDADFTKAEDPSIRIKFD